MGVLKHILSIALSVFLLLACDQKENKTIKAVEPDKKTNDQEEILIDLLSKVDEIDFLCENDLVEKRSLLWEKTGNVQPELIQITSFIDQTGTPYKIIEEYNNGEELAQEGRHIYYLDNGAIFAYFHQYDKWISQTAALLYDEQHFFDLNTGNAIENRIRSSEAEEYLEEAEWQKTTPAQPDLSRAELILNAEEPYQTHFLSLIESDYGLFLLLGEPKEASESRFQTTVAANPEQPFIQDLLRQKEKYKFKKLKIAYTFEGGGNEPVFTVLQSAEWDK